MHRHEAPPGDGRGSSLTTPEAHETLPLYDQEILGTGLSHGTGNRILSDVVRLGANVTVLTRNPDNLAVTIKELNDAQERGEISREIDLEQSIRPIQADFTNRESIITAAYLMRNELVKRGKMFDAVIHASAAGMEPFTTRDKFVGGLVNLRGVKKRGTPEQFAEARDSLQADLAGWIADALPNAMEVNYHGPTRLLHFLNPHMHGPILKEGGKFINFASGWTDQVGQPGVNVPYWYEVPVALPKQAFDRELQRDGTRQAHEANGLYPYTVVGQVVEDTDVGKMFNTLIFPLMDPEEQKRYRAETKPMVMADMSKAVEIILRSDPHAPEIWIPGQPRKLYVLGPTGTPEEAATNITREIPRDHPMLTFRSPI